MSKFSNTFILPVVVLSFAIAGANRYAIVEFLILQLITSILSIWMEKKRVSLKNAVMKEKNW